MSRRHRFIAALLAVIMTCALAAAGCATKKGGDTNTSAALETNAPDTRIDIASYSLIRSERTSAYVTNAFRDLRNDIRDRFGITVSVADDWLQEGDYDSERVAALPEILVGTPNRPEGRNSSDGLGKNEWRVSVSGSKILISGGSDFALAAAMKAFSDVLAGAEKTDDGKLLLDASVLALSGVSEARYLVGLTDQKNSTVRVCDLTGSSVSVADSLWSCKYDFYNIADTRLREYNGREVVLAAFGGKSASMVSFDDKKEELWRTDSTAQNPHACELIPCGVIAVAASNGGEIRFFDAAGDGKAFVSAKLADAHGLLWDPTLNVIWAVGGSVLTAYEVANSGKHITVTERTDLRVIIPTGGAHDLQPYYGNTDFMWVTTGSAVYVYSKNAKQFLTDYTGAAKITRKNVKGIGNFADGSVVLITPDGGFKSWTGADIDFYILTGGEFSHTSVKSTDGGFYKVRVWNKNYQ